MEFEFTCDKNSLQIKKIIIITKQLCIGFVTLVSRMPCNAMNIYNVLYKVKNKNPSMYLSVHSDSHVLGGIHF